MVQLIINGSIPSSPSPLLMRGTSVQLADTAHTRQNSLYPCSDQSESQGVSVPLKGQRGNHSCENQSLNLKLLSFTFRAVCIFHYLQSSRRAGNGDTGALPVSVVFVGTTLSCRIGFNALFFFFFQNQEELTG